MSDCEKINDAYSKLKYLKDLASTLKYIPV
jgi:hypothetical protein